MGFCAIPLRKTTRLPTGLGVLASVKVPFVPSTTPPGISPSANTGPAPPQAPDVPSTNTQSDGLPNTASMPPDALIKAVRPALKPGPFTARMPRSPTNPTTSLSWIGVWLGGCNGLPDELDARTSRILSGVEATPTTHVS